MTADRRDWHCRRVRLLSVRRHCLHDVSRGMDRYPTELLTSAQLAEFELEIGLFILRNWLCGLEVLDSLLVD